MLYMYDREFLRNGANSTSRQFYYKPLFCNNLECLYIISVSEILHPIKSKTTDQF